MVDRFEEMRQDVIQFQSKAPRCLEAVLRIHV
jgi:hypothetical protein